MKSVAQNRKPKETSKVGPGSYNVDHQPTLHKGLAKGFKFGASLRHECRDTNRLSPAPNRYHLLGDFDFQDPLNEEKSLGKKPKFAFGARTLIKDG